MIPDYETNQDLDPIQDDVPINERTPRGLALRSSSDNEEPVELQGLDDLPLERSKYYALLNDMEYGKSIPIFAICNVNRIHQMISRIFCNYEFDLKKFVVSWN